MNFKTLIIRTLSGIVYIALIVFAIMWNEYAFAVIFGLLAVFTTYEFHKLTNKQENVNTSAWLATLTSAVIFISVTCMDIFVFAQNMLFMLYFALIFAFFIIEIFRKNPNPMHNIAYFLLGQIYIALPFFIVTVIYFNFKQFLFALFVIIWTNDVFAYLVGTKFGKHRLCERISPHKSWEGVFGGLVGALIASFVLYKLFYQPAECVFSPLSMNILGWFIFALIIVIFGTLGDLFESLIKRTVGVKDSGSIMPGHGGFLDRLDSVLFAAPAALIFLMALKIGECLIKDR